MGFRVETLNAAISFKDRVSELSKKVDLEYVRAYAETRQSHKKIPDELYEEIDSLLKLREEAIQLEMETYGLVEAAVIGEVIPRDIVEGKKLYLDVPKDMLEKIPTLRVYDYFMLYTREEIVKLRESRKNK